MTVTSSIPVLRASDYPRARRFWIDVMGFRVGEEGGDPARFGIFTEMPRPFSSMLGMGPTPSRARPGARTFIRKM